MINLMFTKYIIIIKRSAPQHIIYKKDENLRDVIFPTVEYTKYILNLLKDNIDDKIYKKLSCDLVTNTLN